MRAIIVCSILLFISRAEANKKLRPGLDCTRSKLGYDYKGGHQRTKTGKYCDSWSFGDRYRLWYYFPDERYDKSFRVKACRNPWLIGSERSGVTSRARPWCWTSNSQWEYCDIPVCAPEFPKNGSRFEIYHGWGCRGKPGYETSYGTRFCRAAVRYKSNGLAAYETGKSDIWVFERDADGLYRIRSDSCHGRPCRHRYWYSDSRGWIYATTEYEMGIEFTKHRWQLIPYADGWRFKRICGGKCHWYFCNQYIGLGGGGFTHKYLGLYDFNQYFTLRNPNARRRYNGGSKTREEVEKDEVCREKLSGSEEKNGFNTPAARVPFTGEDC